MPRPVVFFRRFVTEAPTVTALECLQVCLKQGTPQQQDVPFQSAARFFHDPTNERSRSRVPFCAADQIFQARHPRWEGALIRLPVKQSAEDKTEAEESWRSRLAAKGPRASFRMRRKGGGGGGGHLQGMREDHKVVCRHEGCHSRQLTRQVTVCRSFEKCNGVQWCAKYSDFKFNSVFVAQLTTRFVIRIICYYLNKSFLQKPLQVIAGNCIHLTACLVCF